MLLMRTLTQVYRRRLHNTQLAMATVLLGHHLFSGCNSQPGGLCWDPPEEVLGLLSRFKRGWASCFINTRVSGQLEVILDSSQSSEQSPESKAHPSRQSSDFKSSSESSLGGILESIQEWTEVGNPSTLKASFPSLRDSWTSAWKGTPIFGQTLFLRVFYHMLKSSFENANC